MMYPFMTLNDDTEITHSEMKPDGKVKVYIETPDEKYCFKHATCWLPAYEWEDIPAAATVPNISRVAPPSTGSGIKEKITPTTGNNPNRISIPAI